MNDLCPNMNHGRLNVPIRYCPKCGEIVNRSASSRCDQARHAMLLKERQTYCTDCGKKLAR
ncbi:MAG TPA: hypothetical protein VFV50_15045 [Bdellovibrionales bacterium]|nr:hypothetical protein [Bdellovibrionales bacterium]